MSIYSKICALLEANKNADAVESYSVKSARDVPAKTEEITIVIKNEDRSIPQIQLLEIDDAVEFNLIQDILIHEALRLDNDLKTMSKTDDPIEKMLCNQTKERKSNILSILNKLK